MLHAEFLRQRQPHRVDVGDDDFSRADALRHQRTHDADRPGAGDQHVLADQVEGQRGVDGIAERVEDRGDLVGHVVGDRHDIVLRDRQIFAEGARPVDADAERVAAEMPPPARQLRQWPQTMWPSPETRWPTLYSVTAAPKSATVPTNSWPVTIGTGTVFCAHWSQL